MRLPTLFTLTLGLLSLAATSHSVLFSDGFESNTIDPFWTASTVNGTITHSTTVVHAGSQSLQLSTNTASEGPEKGAYLIHNFGSDQNAGYFSIWIYDTAPGAETNYALMDLLRDGAGQARVGIIDNSANFYVATPPTGENFGITSFSRSLGWHHFELDITAGVSSSFIDGQLVGSSSQPYVFDEVRLTVLAPIWRPNATFYFDDFQANVQAVPEPCSLAAVTLACLGLIRRRRK